MLIGALSQFSISNLYIHFQWQCTTQNAGRDLNKFNHFEGMVHCCLWLFLFRGNTICQEIFFLNLFEIWLLLLLSRLIVKRNNSLALPEIDLEATNIFLFFSFLFFSVYLSYFQLVWQYKKRPPIVSLKFAVSRDCNFGGTSSWSLLKNCPCNCL